MVRKISRALTIAIIAGYLIVGLWPFNFLPRNGVVWLPRANGISFGPQAHVYSEKPLDLTKSASATAQAGAVSIELWLQPDTEPFGEFGAILSLYDGELPENLLILQWHSSLLFRTPVANAQGRRRYREVGVGAVLHKRIPRCIAVTAGAGGTSFYLDGVLVDEYPKLILPPDSLRGRLILGTTADGRCDWLGRIFRLAIFDRTLTAAEILQHYEVSRGNRGRELVSEPGLWALYLFDEGSSQAIRDYSLSACPMVIPGIYQVLRRTVLLPPWKDSLNPLDITINILGFIPFGFTFFIYCVRTLPGRLAGNAVLTSIAAGLISAAIELTQVFLPTRDSSLTDLICNIGGAVTGLLLALAALSLLNKLTPDRD